MAMSGDHLVTVAQKVTDRLEFSEFVFELIENLESHPEEWENISLPAFLASMAAEPGSFSVTAAMRRDHAVPGV